MYDDHKLLELATKYNLPVVQLRERFTFDERPVGQGAFGVVYAATDLSNNDRVAVKVINNYRLTAETVEEFKRVAKIEKNDYVVSYRELLVGRDNNDFPRLCVVMDLVVGNELFASIETLAVRRLSFTPAQLFNIFFNLSYALEHIHMHGVAHRDIKPENVMIRPNGMPVLVDFGLACISDEDCKAREGGTPGYMSPELYVLGPEASGQNTLRGSQLADMYALGCTFFTCITFWNYSTFMTASYNMEESVENMKVIYTNHFRRGKRWDEMPVRAVPPKNPHLVQAFKDFNAIPEFYAATRGLLMMNPKLRITHGRLYAILKSYYDRVKAAAAVVPPPQSLPPAVRSASH